MANNTPRITDEENKEHRDELEAWRGLTRLPIWKYLVRDANADRIRHADGMAALGHSVTDRDRNEHVHAYLDWKNFPNRPAKRIAELEALIERHRKGL